MSRSSEALSYRAAGVWSQRSIPVCWEGKYSLYWQEKFQVQFAVTATWGARSGLDFPLDANGAWPPCQASSTGIRLTPVYRTTPRSAPQTLGQTNGISRIDINFHPDACPGGGGTPCIRGNAVHEFGHALGFAEAVSCQSSDPHAPTGDTSWWSELDGIYTNMANCVGLAGFTSVDAFNVANLYGPERGLPLQTSGGLCIKSGNPQPNTTDGTDVLLMADCNLAAPFSTRFDLTSVTNKFELTPSGRLRHTSSGKCLQPYFEIYTNETRLKTTLDCTSAATAFQASGRQLLHVASNQCLRAAPGYGDLSVVPLILSACDPAVQFKPVITHSDGSFWPAHVAGLRIMPQTMSAATPPDQTVAVLGDNLLMNSAGQFEKHVFAANGSISYRGKCLNPSSGGTNPPNNTPLVYASACGTQAQAFEVTLRGSLRHIASGKCVHPQGGAEKPAIGTTLLLHEGCDLERLRFSTVHDRFQYFMN